MSWNSKGGKSVLIRMLMKEHGISKRKAEKAVNAVFDCMARALRRGEVVELPIGWIRATRRPAKGKKQKLQKFRDIQTGEISHRIVRYPDKIIRFRAKPELIRRGPEPPSPPSPEMIQKGEELEQLLTSLEFPNVTTQDLDSLFGAAEGNLDWLLSRLRTLAQEERKFANFSILCGTVHQLYWIRN
jgi:nucleoid DNA-binding protein